MELRGEEVIKLVLGEARDYFTETRNNIKLPHAVFFRRIFMRETGKTFHFVVVIAKSNSGLEIRP